MTEQINGEKGWYSLEQNSKSHISLLPISGGSSTPHLDCELDVVTRFPRLEGGEGKRVTSQEKPADTTLARGSRLASPSGMLARGSEKGTSPLWYSSPKPGLMVTKNQTSPHRETVKYLICTLCKFQGHGQQGKIEEATNQGRWRGQANPVWGLGWKRDVSGEIGAIRVKSGV